MEKANVIFEGTPEQEIELREYIRGIKTQDGALMPCLQFAQNLYGYLPIEVQGMVAEELDISLSDVYGVATFYSQFTLFPRGKYQIAVCMGTACYVKGAGDILDRIKYLLGIENGQCTMDKKFSLDATRCIGCCGLAPVMTINGKVYGKVTVDQVEKILNEYND
ncbi:MAG: NAD(P)H-dependent oxidoreductase subunit E [Clostridia bacterium]